MKKRRSIIEGAGEIASRDRDRIEHGEMGVVAEWFLGYFGGVA